MSMKSDQDRSLIEAASMAKIASTELASLSESQRNHALNMMAAALESAAEQIASENSKDMEFAKIQVEQGKLNKSLYQRLNFDRAKVLSAANGVRQVASLPDPLGACSLARELAEGLNLYRISCPLGVIAVIFESRPDAFPQIVSLAIKSGNAILLKGGKEAENSNRIIYKVLRTALEEAGLPSESIVLLETREDVNAILKADGFVDLVIPRGSNDLVRFVQSNTKIPVLGHADGICHIYVDEDADDAMAAKVILDAKTQYPSACNAVETVLLHKSKIKTLLPNLCVRLAESHVEIRADENCLAEMSSPDKAQMQLKPACDDDWRSEYCDLILAIKSVDSLDDAIRHINCYGSGHTESIITQSAEKFERFFQRINSAGVYWNASTRFADGFRYGFGAEVGISTSKMHPRGPVGLEGLVSYKYKLLGQGHVVGEFSGTNAKTYTHRDL